jgi:hypothetical protein
MIEGRGLFMHYFDELGSLVNRLWRQRDYDHRLFPEVAQTAFAHLPPIQHTSFEDAVNFGLTTDPLPYQEDIAGLFGQPPLSVYVGRAFRIEILFWLNATPAIHQHSFSGAFGVLQGSSLHLSWSFDVEQRITTHLQYGKVGLKKAELLSVGDFRPILSGNDFIHTTFHLDRPSVSLVIRTLHEEDRLPQYIYLPPAICWDSPDLLPSLKRKEQLLAMLLQCNHVSEYRKRMANLIDTSDTYSVFRYLVHAAYVVKSKETFDELLAHAATKHSSLMERLAPALACLRRQKQIIELREKVSKPDLKFVLALLANITDKMTLFQLLKQRYPTQEPVNVLVDVVGELSAQNLLGSHFNEAWLLLLECLLKGVSDLSSIKAIFEQRYGSEQVSIQGNKLDNLALKLRQFWLVQPYMEDTRAFAVEQVA